MKRLKAATVRPDGSIVIIGGRNAQGKTSLLDSILYAIGGKSAIPSKPLRDGEARGRTVVKLSNGLTATRVFTDKGSKLTLADGEGVFGSPQKILDELFRHAFDPMAFDEMKPADQRAKLAEVLGLDFAGLNRKRQAIFDDRANVNRDGKSAQARLDIMEPYDDDVPDEFLSMETLAGAVEEARDACLAAESAQTGAVNCLDEAERAREAIQTQSETIKAAQESILALESEVKRFSDLAKEEEGVAATLPEREATLEAARDELKGAEAKNAAIRHNLLRDERAAEIAALVAQSEEKTAAMEAIDADKAEQLAAAEFPIEGLGFDDDGVLFNGQPWEQASLAERIRASVAMGFAINPQSGVLLIQDGSSLDTDSMALVANLAAERGGQVWIERVGDGDPGAIIIEDGEVRADAPGDQNSEGQEPDPTETADTPNASEPETASADTPQPETADHGGGPGDAEVPE